MQSVEDSYKKTIKDNCKHFISNSYLKNDLVVTANLREWHDILTMETSSYAHPDMRVFMRPLCDYLKFKIPEIFSDITWNVKDDIDVISEDESFGPFLCSKIDGGIIIHY